jgi:hypothetical protein
MATRKPTPRKTAARPKSEPKPNPFEMFSAQLDAIGGAVIGWLRYRLLRPRTLLVWLLPLVVLGGLWSTDPDGGASTKVWMLRVITAFVAIGFAHMAEKLMFDYPEADRQQLFDAARDEPTGAGLALVARAIWFLALALLFAGQVRAEVPAAARQYLPALQAEQQRFWPDHAMPHVLAGQIDHETACPRRSCWQPTARLKSAREEGAGLGQFTRTWRKDGTQRFDALQELVNRHPALLAGWSWENVYQRADLQLRALLLKARDDFNVFRPVADRTERHIFGLVSHNRGTGGVQAERRACRMTPGCDPGRWFGHVEKHCTASRAALYGQRSACDISRHYPKDVIHRAAKYRGLV